MKIAVVGGGSTSAPELVDGIARLRDVVQVDDIARIDPAADRLALDVAVRGGQDRVVRALMARPLVAQTATADRLTNLLLGSNRGHLRWLS